MKAWAPLLLLLGLCACTAERDAERRGQCGGQGAAACVTSACPRLQDGGAVVVRWRVMDALSGRLFSRSQCCCAKDLPDPARGTCVAAGGDVGASCPPGPAWYIPEIALTARPLGGGATQSFTFCERCSNAELTTEFCLAEGEYLLQVEARLWRVAEASCWSAQAAAVTPSGVRRTVKPGQIVNLDVVVLQVNGAALVTLDGGALDGAPGDGGVSDGASGGG